MGKKHPKWKEVDNSIHGEIWKDIPGFSGYQASNLGRIRRHPHVRGMTICPGRVLKAPGVCTKGYRQIEVRADDSNKRRTTKVHRLVALAFLGPKPFDHAQVNHIDGDKLNNRADNLEYVTPAENMAHAVKTGLFKPPPSRAGIGQKLNWESVREIRSRVSSGESRKSLAEKFGIHVMTVGEIVRGEIWKDQQQS